MESKRLGRTLPAVVNGLSAAQAQSQGLIEVASDTDTASVANSEPLFVGESDDESVSSRSRSGSPQNTRNDNGEASPLNPAATPFDPKPTTTTSSARPNPFQAATTFGKPSGTPVQTNSKPVFDFNPKSTNQAAHTPFGSKEPPKFNFLPLETGSKAKESKDTPSAFGTKQPPKATFPPTQLGSEPSKNSNGPGPSPFAPAIDKKTTFGQPSTTFPTTTSAEQPKAVAEKLPTSSEAVVPSKPKSVFDLATAPSAPYAFSFGTSPLFGSADGNPKSPDTKSNPLQSLEGNDHTIPAPQQKDAAIKLPSSQTSSSSHSTSFSPFQPPSSIIKETSLPQAASPTSGNSTHPLMPRSESQFNSKSSQPFPAFPSSTAPVFQPPLSPLSNKSAQAIQTPNSVPEYTASNSQNSSNSPVVKRSAFEPGQKQSTSSTSQIDPKSVALDQLSKFMLLEDNGIIQHFIEFSVGPIIKASIAQFNDDLSWKEASQSLPSGSRCGERMLIGNRGMSCSFTSQEVFEEVES